jgi:hypothetical protein
MAKLKNNSLIKAYRVRIQNAANQDVGTFDFKNGPQAEMMQVQAQPQQVFRVRQNTDGGEFRVTGYHGNQRNVFAQANPTEPLERAVAAGFRVLVEALPKSQWLQGPAVEVEPPKVHIARQANVWLVTFEPKQYPSVCTIAILHKAPDGNLAGSKNEDLPSLPFPSNPKHASGSILIPLRNAFGAADGAPIRLGVRGAGIMVTAVLPKANETLDVKPGDFEIGGPADPTLLSDAYVNEKYNEKKALVQYT